MCDKVDFSTLSSNLTNLTNIYVLTLISANMGMSDRKNRNNPVQVEMEGRSQPTIKSKINNTVLVQKSEAIRYTLTELKTD